MIQSTISRKLLAVGAFAALVGLASCSSSTTTTPPPTVTPSAAYKATLLVGDMAGAANIDPTLKNEWGMSVSSSGNWWLSSNKGGVSNIYDNTGATKLAPVTIPFRAGGTATAGTPTGVVFNSTSDFKGGHFIFCSFDGIISAWTGTPLASAVIEATDPSTTAFYTGMALASNASANYLYVADFKNNKIVVYDKNYAPVTLGTGSFAGTFTDNASPVIPSTAGPYNITNIGGLLYVTYSTFYNNGTSPAGNGYVSVFNPDGSFVKRFASGGTLNEPWGIAIAPATFGQFKNATLVGNFGDGTINAYDATGAYLGQISKDTISTPLHIDGIWGLTVTSTGSNDPNALYFTAGPGGEIHGLFGFIKPQ